MQRFEFGNKNAMNILVQPADLHDISYLEKEIEQIKALTEKDFRLIAFAVDDWNRDLSPSKAPAVFGDAEFGGEAQKTLDHILNEIKDTKGVFYIGGYSLAGLFALWAVYRTDIFTGVAAASPSVWFPGFTDYIQTTEIQAEKVYLSLGDREPKTKNPVLATVGEKIKKTYSLLVKHNVSCILEWNSGNHFADADLRTARAFAWLLNN
ncbi:MAG: esterase [Clostridia bacterium]|nr:esterase [Clostridia bacterium]